MGVKKLLTPDELEAAVLGAQWVAYRGDAVLARAARCPLTGWTSPSPGHGFAADEKSESATGTSNHARVNASSGRQSSVTPRPCVSWSSVAFACHSEGARCQCRANHGAGNGVIVYWQKTAGTVRLAGVGNVYQFPKALEGT